MKNIIEIIIFESECVGYYKVIYQLQEIIDIKFDFYNFNVIFLFNIIMR